jgi:hypothetical protein
VANKYNPDLLNLKYPYEFYFSEPTILSPVETQMCNAAALICSNCPVQAMWHTRGVLRLGGTMEQARFAQEVGLRVAEYFGCVTGDIVRVDDIDFDDEVPH